MAKHVADTHTRKVAIVGGILAALLAAAAGVAEAAPITCPGGQTAQQVSPGNFLCVNNGGNADQSGQTKNPND
jgi:hypothetical protein